MAAEEDLEHAVRRRDRLSAKGGDDEAETLSDKDRLANAIQRATDSRARLGLPVEDSAIPDMVRRAMRQHVLFRHVEDQRFDADFQSIASILVPLRLTNGDVVTEIASQHTCVVVGEGELVSVDTLVSRPQSSTGSPRSPTETDQQEGIRQDGEQLVYSPGALFNPFALLSVHEDHAPVVSRGVSLVWTLTFADFRCAIAQTELDTLATRVDFVKQVPILQGIPRTLLVQFSEAMREATYQPGSSIVIQGEPGSEFFIIKHGLVQVVLNRTLQRSRSSESAPKLHQSGSSSKLAEETELEPMQDHEDYYQPARSKSKKVTGKPYLEHVDEGEDPHVFVLLNELSDGDFFGEMAILNDCPRSATVRVPQGAAPVTCLVLEKHHFSTLLGGAANEALEQQSRLRLLEQIPLLANLRRDDLEAILKSIDLGETEEGHGFRKRFRAGEVVARAGDVAHCLFVVYEGCVKKVRPSTTNASSGSAVRFAEPKTDPSAAASSVEGDAAAEDQDLEDVLLPGDFFGDVSLMAGAPFDVDYVAHAPTHGMDVGAAEIICFNKACFEKLLGEATVGQLLQEHFQQHQRREVLRAVPLFTTFTDSELDVVASMLSYQTFNKGDRILVAGKVTECLFILFDGDAIREPDALIGGHRTRIPPKSHLGIEGLHGEPSKYSVTAMGNLRPGSGSAEPTVCLVLDRESYATLDEHLEQKLQEAATSRQARASNYSIARRLSVGKGMQRELPESLELKDLQVMRILGEGNYGRVKLVMHHETGFVLALKCMNKARIVAKRQTKNILREADVLSRARHPFILRLVTTFQSHHQLFMLIELVPAGDLWPYIYRKRNPKFRDALPRDSVFGGFCEDHCRFYAACVVAGLEYIHSLGIAYRDLKPENIMLDGMGYLKIIDFGLCKYIPYFTSKKERMDKSFTMCGTTEYLSPESVTGRGHDKTLDMWALGCFLYELFCGRTPFRGKDSKKTVANIVDSKNHLQANRFLKEGSPAAVDLIRRLLEPSPALRLGGGAFGWSSITAHEFFASPGHSFDWDQLLLRQLPAPFIPKIKSALDMSGFEDSDPSVASEEVIPDFTGDQKPFVPFGGTIAKESKFASLAF